MGNLVAGRPVAGSHLGCESDGKDQDREIDPDQEVREPWHVSDGTEGAPPVQGRVKEKGRYACPQKYSLDNDGGSLIMAI